MRQSFASKKFIPNGILLLDFSVPGNLEKIEDFGINLLLEMIELPERIASVFHNSLY